MAESLGGALTKKSRPDDSRHVRALSGALSEANERASEADGRASILVTENAELKATLAALARMDEATAAEEKP